MKKDKKKSETEREREREREILVADHSSRSMGSRGRTGATAEFEFPLRIFIVLAYDVPHLRNKLAGEPSRFLYAAPIYAITSQQSFFMFHPPPILSSPRRQDLKYLWVHVKNRKSCSFLDKIQMKLACAHI